MYSSIKFVTYLILLQLSLEFTAVSSAPLLGSNDHIGRRSVSSCSRIFVLKPSGKQNLLAVDENGDLLMTKTNSRKVIFQKYSSQPGRVSFKSVEHGYYLAVNEQGMVSAIHLDDFNDEGSGAESQYYTEFKIVDHGINSPKLKGYQQLQSLQGNNEKQCVVSFNKNRFACTENKRDIFTTLIKIDPVKCD